MNPNKYFSIKSAILLTASALAWSSCADTWDNHYGVSDNGVGASATLMQEIEKDPSLSNFLYLINNIGEGQMLNSDEQFTVFAPQSLTKEQADSVIEIYNREKAAGVKQQDNKAVTQFLYNHVALYSRPLSTETDDIIPMLNKKYMNLKGDVSAVGYLNNNQILNFTPCYNGSLYKIKDVQPFLHNVREILEAREEFDSVYSFIKSYDEYILDEEQSVPMGIVDGQTVYVDSVTYSINTLLSRYGYIQREDSSYSFIAPTTDVWKQEYARYKNMYNFHPKTINQGDSLAGNYAAMNIISGRFFNNRDMAHNSSPKDSLCNTQYYEKQSYADRTNVYYHPEEGILNGLEKIECSNGAVYIDNTGVIDPKSTFFTRRELSCISVHKGHQLNNKELMNCTQGTMYDVNDYGVRKSFHYLSVSPASGSSTAIDYMLPNILSNIYYNVYIVTVPDLTNPLPQWFEASSVVIDEKTGQYLEPNASTAAQAVCKNLSTATIFKNQLQQRADFSWDNVPNSETIKKQTGYDNCFWTSAEKIDTIFLGTVHYDYSDYGLTNTTAKIEVRAWSNLTSSTYAKMYSRNFRHCKLILIPFEKEEDAENAKWDIDAFNDDLINANKKK